MLPSLMIPSSGDGYDNGEALGYMRASHHVTFTTTSSASKTVTGLILQALQHLKVSKRYHAKEDDLPNINRQSMGGSKGKINPRETSSSHGIGSVLLTLESSLRSFPDINLGNIPTSTPMTSRYQSFVW
ncbi:hypothetical protein Pmani_029806 [Petrolisthes manimaculis]|uniref:Uncharacterized protein n=1 Tax=Petrolisthes manimaculis TaxID=1843537 RepID=A0AAE1NZ92_9EUCA|nr:hypothetical protein Pmani_029806 [Petrolisthes manimaculis]